LRGYDLTPCASLRGHAHDHTKSDFLLLRLPIAIGRDAWIGGGAFVGSGVTIDDGGIARGASRIGKNTPKIKTQRSNRFQSRLRVHHQFSLVVS
jgi:acetyltransferase-like isoleucine patch superfamily enzyme